ncbi:MAG: hypothetical protein JW925_08130 [Syntrophaceae bacterium]|nr:hypothetical protein [Syntrophaceae bacterium]
MVCDCLKYFRSGYMTLKKVGLLKRDCHVGRGPSRNDEKRLPHLVIAVNRSREQSVAGSEGIS